MNQELANVIKIYATQRDIDLSNYLIGKYKNTLISILVDLLTMYITDKNSSTIREFLTVTLAGYTHQQKKIGYNGYKQDSIGKPIKCEAKPKNVDTHSHPLRKLNGGGNFTDYTFARLEKDKRENPNILISGFINGKLIYILEFPFNYSKFTTQLKERLMYRFKDGKDKTGQFLRSANFHYKHFINCPNLKFVYLSSKVELQKYKPYIVKGFYEFLEGKAQNE